MSGPEDVLVVIRLYDVKATSFSATMVKIGDTETSLYSAGPVMVGFLQIKLIPADDGNAISSGI